MAKAAVLAYTERFKSANGHRKASGSCWRPSKSCRHPGTQQQWQCHTALAWGAQVGGYVTLYPPSTLKGPIRAGLDHHSREGSLFLAVFQDSALEDPGSGQASTDKCTWQWPMGWTDAVALGSCKSDSGAWDFLLSSICIYPSPWAPHDIPTTRSLTGPASANMLPLEMCISVLRIILSLHRVASLKGCPPDKGKLNVIKSSFKSRYFSVGPSLLKHEIISTPNWFFCCVTCQ